MYKNKAGNTLTEEQATQNAKEYGMEVSEYIEKIGATEEKKSPNGTVLQGDSESSTEVVEDPILSESSEVIAEETPTEEVVVEETVEETQSIPEGVDESEKPVKYILKGEVYKDDIARKTNGDIYVLSGSEMKLGSGGLFATLSKANKIRNTKAGLGKRSTYWIEGVERATEKADKDGLNDDPENFDYKSNPLKNVFEFSSEFNVKEEDLNQEVEKAKQQNPNKEFVGILVETQYNPVSTLESTGTVDYKKAAAANTINPINLSTSYQKKEDYQTVNEAFYVFKDPTTGKSSKALVTPDLYDKVILAEIEVGATDLPIGGETVLKKAKDDLINLYNSKINLYNKYPGLKLESGDDIATVDALVDNLFDPEDGNMSTLANLAMYSTEEEAQPVLDVALKPYGIGVVESGAGDNLTFYANPVYDTDVESKNYGELIPSKSGESITMDLQKGIALAPTSERKRLSTEWLYKPNTTEIKEELTDVSDFIRKNATDFDASKLNPYEELTEENFEVYIESFNTQLKELVSIADRITDTETEIFNLQTALLQSENLDIDQVTSTFKETYKLQETLTEQYELIKYKSNLVQKMELEIGDAILANNQGTRVVKDGELIGTNIIKNRSKARGDFFGYTGNLIAETLDKSISGLLARFPELLNALDFSKGSASAQERARIQGMKDAIIGDSKKFFDQFKSDTNEVFTEEFNSDLVGQVWTQIVRMGTQYLASFGNPVAMQFLMAGEAMSDGDVMLNQYNAEMRRNGKPELTNAQKSTFLLTYGTVIAKLERIGIKSMTGGSKSTKFIIEKVFNLAKKGKKITPVDINRLTDKGIQDAFSRGIIKRTAGGITESATEIAQYEVERLGKDYLDDLNDVPVFDSPAFMSNKWKEEIWEIIKVSFATSVVIGTGQAAVQLQKNRSSKIENKKLFKLVSDVTTDPVYKYSYLHHLALDVATKNITPQQAQKNLNDFNKIAKIFQSIPKNLTVEQQQDLFMKKRQVESLQVLFKTATPKEQKEINQKLSDLNKEINDLELGEEKPSDESEKVFDKEDVADLKGLTDLKDIKARIKKGRAVLKKLLPNVKIYEVDDDEGMEKQTGSKKKAAGRYYNGNIYINMSRANKRTLGHEIFHAFFLSKFTKDGRIDNEAATKEANKMFEAIKNNKSLTPELQQKLNKFAESYPEGVKSEESLAELTGILSEKGKQLDVSTKKSMQLFYNKMINTLGLPKSFLVSDLEGDEIVVAFNDLSKALTEGTTLKSTPLIKKEKEDAIQETQPVRSDDVIAKPKDPTSSKGVEGEVRSTEEKVKDEEKVIKNIISKGKPVEVYTNTKNTSLDFTKLESQDFSGTGKPELIFLTPSSTKFSDYGPNKFKVSINPKKPYYQTSNKVLTKKEIRNLKDQGYDAIITHPFYKPNKPVKGKDYNTPTEYIMVQNMNNNVEGKDNRDELDINEAMELIPLTSDIVLEVIKPEITVEELTVESKGDEPGTIVDGTPNITRDQIDESVIPGLDVKAFKIPGVTFPKQTSMDEVLKKSGGAAVFINSDATKVGKVVVNGVEYELKGGPNYSFLDENIKDNVGFAASEDGKISNLQTVSSNVAQLRDKTNPKHKGKPVAVFVVSQNSDAMFGEWYASEYTFNAINKSIKSGKYPGGVAQAKKDLIDAIPTKKEPKKLDKSNNITKAWKDWNKNEKAKQKLIKKIKESFNNEKARIEIGKTIASKDFTFDFRKNLFANLIPGTQNSVNSGGNRNLKQALANQGVTKNSFYDEFTDENFLPTLQSSGPTYKKESIGGITVNGFYHNPNEDIDSQIENSKGGTDHQMFNSSFKSEGDPFLLDKGHNINKLMPNVGYPDKEGYNVYNNANKTKLTKKNITFAEKLKMSKWLNENGHSDLVVNPFTSVAMSIYTGGVSEEITNPQLRDQVSSMENVYSKTKAFKKWFGDSKLTNPDGSPTLYFHGTSYEFDKFRGYGTDSDAAKKLVDDKIKELEKKASQIRDKVFKKSQDLADLAFVEGEIEIWKNSLNEGAGPIFFSPSPEFANEFATNMANNKGKGSVIPAYIKVENPFDFDNPAHVEKLISIIDNENAAFLSDKDKFRKSLKSESNWLVIEEWSRELQDAGFDGFFVNEAVFNKADPTPVKNIAVFNSNQVKSPFNPNPISEDERFQIEDRKSIISRVIKRKNKIFFGDDVFDPEQSFSFFNKFNRKLFTSNKMLPKNTAEFLRQKEHYLNSLTQDAANIAGDANKIINKYATEEDKQEVLKSFDARLRGLNKEDIKAELDKLKQDKATSPEKEEKIRELEIQLEAITNYSLDPDLESLADRMRLTIDNLSRMMVAEGYIEAEDQDKVLSNLGSYLNRTYEAYNNPNYLNTVSETNKLRAETFMKVTLRPQAVTRAKQKYKTEFPTEQQINDELDLVVSLKLQEYTEKERQAGVGRASSEATTDKSQFKPRKEIPLVIRELMGETLDPIKNFANTVSKMSQFVATSRLQDQIKEDGLASGYILEEGLAEANKNKTITTSGPLKGYVTTPEIAEALEKTQGDNGSISQAYNIYKTFIGRIKYNKTILSPGTHAKNVLGNVGFVLKNGHIDITKPGWQGLQSLKVLSKNDEESRNKYNRYLELGVVNSSAGLGELRSLFNAENLNDALIRASEKRKNGVQNLSKLAKALSTANLSKTQVARIMEKAYQAEDDFFKIVAFETERKKYAEALYGKGTELTPKQSDEVDRVASDIVQDIYPTYDKIPGIVEILKSSPIIGSFVSFQSEVWRTTSNNIQLALDEMASDNKGIKKIGIKRLSTILGYVGLKNTIFAAAGYGAGTGMAGLFQSLGGDDDDEMGITRNDITNFVAPWQVNSDLIMRPSEPGFLKYIDVGASDPHGAIAKVFNAIMSGDTPQESALNGFLQFVEPFLGAEIGTQKVVQILQNDSGYGKKIYKTTDTYQGKMGNILLFLIKGWSPGGVTSIMRMTDKDKSVSDEVLAMFTGYRTFETDISDQLRYKIKNLVGEFRFDAGVSLVDQLKKVEGYVPYADVPFDIRGNYLIEQKSGEMKRLTLIKKEIYREVARSYNSAIKLGVPESKATEVVKGLSFISEEEARKIIVLANSGNNFTEFKGKATKAMEKVFKSKAKEEASEIWEKYKDYGYDYYKLQFDKASKQGSWYKYDVKIKPRP